MKSLFIVGAMKGGPKTGHQNVAILLCPTEKDKQDQVLPFLCTLRKDCIDSFFIVKHFLIVLEICSHFIVSRI